MKPFNKDDLFQPKPTGTDLEAFRNCRNAYDKLHHAYHKAIYDLCTEYSDVRVCEFCNSKIFESNDFKMVITPNG